MKKIFQLSTSQYLIKTRIDHAAQWLAGFAPWRALVAAHLWASLADGAY